MTRRDLSFASLRAAYAGGGLTPRAMVDRLHADMLAEDALLDRRLWIRRASLDEMQAHAAALDGRDPDSLPLYGIPFAIKDNVDLGGVPTTAGCPAYAYTPERSATVVQRLVDAGAIPVGKTNLDQFATGLVGVRSPYGACRNAIDGDWISGGSSAGSAVAVALGLASFALGTDTAGSGRVPAMLNNLVGCKPTRGLIPTTGVVPACRTLDVVSIFALTAGDAGEVLSVAQGDDGIDAYARTQPPSTRSVFGRGSGAGFAFGVPRADDLQFFGNADGPRLFARAVAMLRSLGGTPVEVDLRPFFAAARLLYDGPWLAERYAAIRSLIERDPGALHPVTRAIIEPAGTLRSVDAFESMYALKALQRATGPVWRTIDCLVTPTAGTTHTVAAVEADPLRLNAELGTYTNFVNLLDLAAVAVPTGTIDGSVTGGRPAGGLPWGVSLVAPAGDDVALLQLAARLHALGPATVGATPHAPHAPHAPAAPAMPATLAMPALSAMPAMATMAAPAMPHQPSASTPFPQEQTMPIEPQVHVAVCGAHMAGLPLNGQLTQRGGRLVRVDKTAACYRCYLLPGGPPYRPGLIRVAEGEGGAAIELEVWELPETAYGGFVAGIPSPLGIGTVRLADGSTVQGFVCEAIAATGATDITAFGGWRAYLASKEAA